MSAAGSDAESAAEDGKARHPLMHLSDEEREFVLRMVLASGSLKELARHYGVSYPTIRSRLDRLMARLQHILEGRPADAMADLLADLVQRGDLRADAARQILDVHRKQSRPQEEA